MALEQALQTVIDEFVEKPTHAGVALSLYSEKTGAQVDLGAGNLSARTPFFGTGITKIYVAALIMKLCEEGKLDLDTPFKHYMPECKVCVEVHVRDGADYTEQVTLRHLMGHRSGLGDYFIFKKKAGPTRRMQHDARLGRDSSWTFEDVISRARLHGAIALPGVGRASFSDANYHILGKVIESVEGKSLTEVVQERISGPLGLSSTYLYCDPSDARPSNFMSDEKEVLIPRTMASFQADGGIVTTAVEALKFTRTVLEGRFMSREYVDKMYEFRKVSFPLEFGLGLQRIRIPWWRALPYRMNARVTRMFHAGPEVVGYYGIGGTFAVHAVNHGYYCAGTANQLSDVAHGVVLSLRAIETADMVESKSYRRAYASVAAE